LYTKQIIQQEENLLRKCGVAVVGALAGINPSAAAVPKAPENKELLVAPCGLYCGACPMYIATQDKDEKKIDAFMKQGPFSNSKLAAADIKCDGCIGGGQVAVFCRMCNMRECAEKKENVTRCSDCGEFPCSKLPVSIMMVCCTTRRSWQTAAVSAKSGSRSGQRVRRNAGVARSAMAPSAGTTVHVPVAEPSDRKSYSR